MASKELHLESWINFGKYRKRGKRLCDIIETEEGQKWVRWITKNSDMTLSPLVEEKIKSINDARSILPT